MHLDESMDSASSSSSTLHDYDDNYNIAPEDRIRRLVLSIKLSARRNKIMHEGEEGELKRIHLRLENMVLKDPDARRQRRLLRLLPAANRFRELLFYLRKLRDSATSVSASRYISKMHEALTAVMSQSFEEEYRRTADILGVLDALAEALICDVDLFGVKCLNENLTIRKLIANSLTNLSFGSLQRKRRLCCYPNFIEYSVKVISAMQTLAQAYAALLRNLSWNSDPETSKQLHCTIQILIQASMRAHAENDSKCLCATLSALWNMSFSSQNQQAICQNSRFLETLVDLLINDPQKMAVVEAATGVLKYASHCFSQSTGDYMHVNVLQKMVLRLVDLLKSSSFTTINNCLHVIQQLLKYDYQLRAQIRLNQKAMPILYYLGNSKVLDVRNTVITILQYLEAKKCQALLNSFDATPEGIMESFNSGLPVSSFFESPHLGKLKSVKNCSPTHFCMEDDIDEGTGSLSSVAADGASSSHGAVYTGVSQQLYANYMQHNATLERNYSVSPECVNHTSTNASDYENLRYEKINGFPKESAKIINEEISECDGDDIDFDESETEEVNLLKNFEYEVEDSVRCTRNSSAESIESVSTNQHSNCNSYSNSAANSGQFSPISASELPDSPSQLVNNRVNGRIFDLCECKLLNPELNNGTLRKSSNGHSKEPQLKEEPDKVGLDGPGINAKNESTETSNFKKNGMSSNFPVLATDAAGTSSLPRKSLSDSAGNPTLESKPVPATSSLPPCEILYLACV